MEVINIAAEAPTDSLDSGDCKVSASNGLVTSESGSGLKNDDASETIQIEEEKGILDALTTEDDVLAKPMEEAAELKESSQTVKLEDVANETVDNKVQSDSDDAKPLIKRGRPRRSKQSKSPVIAARTRSMKFAQTPTLADENNTKATRKKKKETLQKTNSKLNKSFENIEKQVGNDKTYNENQCRICLNEENLENIFTLDETDTIAAKIMIICSSVKITRRDLLPQFICSTCLQSLHVALNFKTLCETTDKDLRSNIKRNKSKPRRQTEFILIDCNEISEVEEEPKIQSDGDEFHLSNNSDCYGRYSDSDSSYNAKKRKTRRTTRKKRKPNSSKSTNQITCPAKRIPSKKVLSNVNSEKNSNHDNSSEEENVFPPKKRRTLQKISKTSDDTVDARKKEAQCVYCNKMFPSMILLREHKKSHAGEKPFTCDICNRSFKLIGSFKSHQEKHNEADSLMCMPCNKHYPNKTELRRHLVELHGEPVAAFVCEKCKRAFTTERRLERHKESKCPGFEQTLGSAKKIKPETDSIALGRDLFKCVAPMTTTYWSDSFSD